MKKFYPIVWLLFLLFSYTDAQAVLIRATHCAETCRTVQKGKFKRSYQHVKRGKAARVENAISVTAEDFSRHIEVGNQRTMTYYEDSVYFINMDIGIIDPEGTTAQEWTIPDYDWISDKLKFDYEHIEVSEARVPDFYPEATHVVHDKTNGKYEYFELSNQDLFLLGFDEGEGEPDDYYTTVSPIPLGLGEGFTGVVTLVYDEDPTYDSTKYIQKYDVVGYGTLNTPDGDSFEALKLIFSEKGLDYTKDGEEVEDFFYEEIVWYTKEGYHVRMGIDDAWETEGEAALDYIIMQRVERTGGVTSTRDKVASQQTKLYPNPVKAGEKLLLELPDNTQVEGVELFNLQGQAVGSVPVTNLQSQKLEVAVPENLAVGMYFYKITLKGGESHISGRVVVE